MAAAKVRPIQRSACGRFKAWMFIFLPIIGQRGMMICL
jgi:hypothetical protein